MTSRIWCACLYIKWASKSMIKFQFEEIVTSETLLHGFGSVDLKRGQNSLERCESWCARLSVKRATKSIIEY